MGFLGLPKGSNFGSAYINMVKERLAIIGTGISGLGAAWYLKDAYDITLFEREERAGGHTHTVQVRENDQTIPIDTGFMVFNHATYPLFTSLLKELKVETFPTSMSFSVQHLPSGLEYSGSGFNGLFAQRKNLFSLRHWRMLKEIARFNREAPRILDEPAYEDMDLETYLRKERFSEDMFRKYLVPMSSAVWSAPMNAMLRFHARTLVRFFYNHGFLGLNTQHQWYTLRGGSIRYRDKILAYFPGKLHLAEGAIRISRSTNKATVETSKGSYEFNKVIIASHADDTLKMLEGPEEKEQQLLSCFHFQNNMAILHTDPSVMPKARRTWSSWNYRMQEQYGTLVASTVYWMNSLQNVSDQKNYFVSINDTGNIREDQILKKINFTHPLFDVHTAKAQTELDSLNEKGPVYFCGAWFRYGFHEDGLWSAHQLAQRLL